MEKKKYKRLRKILRIIIAIIIAIALCVVVFLNVWPAFGGKSNEADRADYTKRAKNFDGKKFTNETEFEVMRDVEDGAEDGVVSKKSEGPEKDLPTVTPNFLENPSEKDVTVTWFGHSSLMIQIHGMNVLIDPVLSNRSSPVGFVGPERFSQAPIDVNTMPEVDVLIISHDHYDHLDYNVIKELDSKVKHYVVPLGVENHLERWKVKKDKITNMAWWEETTIDGLTIGCTPARHYSGRSVNDQAQTLWASWVLKDKYHQIFESGDTGYDQHFKKIQEKYGDFDLALIDCAQYDLQWPDVHMNPEESYKAAQELHAKAVMPIHWGAFQLANHPWDDPVERFVRAGEDGKIPVATPRIGETIHLDKIDTYTNRWWRTIS